MSDDSMMMKQILETHAPDGMEVDAKPLLSTVEDVLNRATQSADTLVMVRPAGPSSPGCRLYVLWGDVKNSK